MIFVDGHVHIYDCYDMDALLDAAFVNFRAASEKAGVEKSDALYVMLLVEGETDRWFSRLCCEAEKDGEFVRQVSSTWNVQIDKKYTSLIARTTRDADAELIIIAGQQLVSREKIEVLNLFCRSRVANGLSLQETVFTIQQDGGIVVLPWGAGKWLGKRGRVISDIIDAQWKDGFFLGDNGGRPHLWPDPPLFAMAQKYGIAVLPGSDPLPLTNEARRIGSYGFLLPNETREKQNIVMQLKTVLLEHPKGQPLVSYGKLQHNMRFLVNQFKLRMS